MYIIFPYHLSAAALLLAYLFFTIKQVHTHPIVTIASSNTDKQSNTPRAITSPGVVLFTRSLSLAEALLLFVSTDKVTGTVDSEKAGIVAEVVLEQ